MAGYFLNGRENNMQRGNKDGQRFALLRRSGVGRLAAFKSTDVTNANCRLVVSGRVGACLVDRPAKFYCAVKVDDIMVSNILPTVAVDMPTANVSRAEIPSCFSR